MNNLGFISSSMKGAPGVPTIGSATDLGSGRAYNNGAASVTFTPAGTGAAATSYTVISSPGGYSTTSASSPITITGLQSGVSYTYSVRANNASGSSAYSNSTTPVTATTVPQAPTLGTVTRSSNTSVSIPFSDGANGGSAITSRTIASSPSVSLSYTIFGTPVAVTASFTKGQSYTFTMTATNANGTSAASAASNSVMPWVPITPVITGISYAATGSTTGKLTWTGTNIDSVLYTGDSSLYPPPYNYGAFTASWTGTLINITPGQSYSGTITPASSDNTIGSSFPWSFTQPT